MRGIPCGGAWSAAAGHPVAARRWRRRLWARRGAHLSAGRARDPPADGRPGAQPRRGAARRHAERPDPGAGERSAQRRRDRSVVQGVGSRARAASPSARARPRSARASAARAPRAAPPPPPPPPRGWVAAAERRGAPGVEAGVCVVVAQLVGTEQRHRNRAASALTATHLHAKCPPSPTKSSLPSWATTASTSRVARPCRCWASGRERAVDAGQLGDRLAQLPEGHLSAAVRPGRRRRRHLRVGERMHE